MQQLFLIGGGWEESSFKRTFGRFVRAGSNNGRCKILLILAMEDVDARDEIAELFSSMFADVEDLRTETETLFPAEESDLTAGVLSSIEPSCIFVGGGLTPRYQELLCSSREFIDFIVDRRLPYGGFSAGSAIAANRAIVGGWRARHRGKDTPILDPDFSEDLDFIEVRRGLGFLDYPIDVHGSQWGTLTRVIHAVDQGLIENGLVIDEATMVEQSGSKLRVFGNGQAYLVNRVNAKIEVSIFRDGDVVP